MIEGIGKIKKIEERGSGLELDMSFFEVKMENTTKENISDILSLLNAGRDIIYASPMYDYPDGTAMLSYSNRIIVELKSPDDFPVLQRICHDFPCRKILSTISYSNSLDNFLH